jgi:WhiB family redox-sensing transcriptional regulator
MEIPEFVAIAPCAGVDPWLFDQNQIDLALTGLDYCRFCPFWVECNEWVKPKLNFYDGVVAGKVWKNGRVLARLDESSPNRLIIGEADEQPENNDAVELRGSELLGD